MAMVGRCIRLTVCPLVLCLGGSAAAQEPGKTLYAAQCERCHKSPHAVTTFHGGVDLQTFLGELHYADTPESAASITAYLKGLEQVARSDEAPPKKRKRRTKHRSEASPSQSAPSQPPGQGESTTWSPWKKLFDGGPSR